MSPRRSCAQEAWKQDFAFPIDPRAWAGSSDSLHDRRQGLVSPVPQPRRTKKRRISRVGQHYTSAEDSVGPLRRRRSASAPVPSRPLVPEVPREVPRPMSYCFPAGDLARAAHRQGNIRRLDLRRPPAERVQDMAVPMHRGNQDEHSPSASPTPAHPNTMTIFVPSQVRPSQMPRNLAAALPRQSLPHPRCRNIDFVFLTRTIILSDPPPPNEGRSFGAQTAVSRHSIRQIGLAWLPSFRIARRSEECPSLAPGNNPLRQLRQRLEPTSSDATSNYEECLFDLLRGARRIAPLPNVNEDAAKMRMTLLPPTTRQAHPGIQHQAQDKISRRPPLRFPQRPLPNRTESEIDALAEASGRLCLASREERGEPTALEYRAAAATAALGRRDARLERLRAALGAARRAVEGLKRELYEELRRVRAGREQRSEGDDDDSNEGDDEGR